MLDIAVMVGMMCTGLIFIQNLEKRHMTKKIQVSVNNCSKFQKTKGKKKKRES